MATAPPGGMSNGDVTHPVPLLVATGRSAPPLAITTSRLEMPPSPAGRRSVSTVSYAVVLPSLRTSTRKPVRSPASRPAAGPTMVLVSARCGSPSVSAVASESSLGWPVPGSSKENVGQVGETLAVLVGQHVRYGGPIGEHHGLRRCDGVGECAEPRARASAPGGGCVGNHREVRPARRRSRPAGGSPGASRADTPAPLRGRRARPPAPAMRGRARRSRRGTAPDRRWRSASAGPRSSSSSATSPTTTVARSPVV